MEIQSTVYAVAAERSSAHMSSYHRAADKQMRFRKHIRLKHYDYKTNGYYFVTICCSCIVSAERSSATSGKAASGRAGSAATRHEAELRSAATRHEAELRSADTVYNAIIEKHLKNLEKHKGVKLDHYKLMPNHLHFIMILEGAKLSLCRYIQEFKAKTTLEIKKNGFFGKRYWQPNYYEHIIRNDMSLAKVREYIENNPVVEKLNWKELDP